MTNNSPRDETKQSAPREDSAQPEQAYKTKEMGEIVGAATSTVRKYSVALEGEGYSFSKNPQKQRLFVDRDIVMLRKMIELTKAGTLVSNAAKIVANESEERGVNVSSKDDEAMLKLLDYVKKQDEYIQRQERRTAHLLRKIDNLDYKINKAINLIEVEDGKEDKQPKQDNYIRDDEATIYKEDNKKKKGIFNRIFDK